MKYIRPFWRFLFFVVYTSRIVLEIWWQNHIRGIDIRRSMRIRRRWARVLLRSIGVRVTTTGTPPEVPCILISNHRSYLDPILLLQNVDAYPVAKAELANWPIIGKGAAMAGILYLKRENVKSRAGTLQGIQQIIAQGHPVIIYPEGTTSALPGTLPFKRGVFQLAAKHHIPVVPVAVVFAHQSDFWVGKESFLSHAGRRFRLPEIPVSVHYGAPMIHENAEQLLQETQKWIESILLSQPADA